MGFGGLAAALSLGGMALAAQPSWAQGKVGPCGVTPCATFATRVRGNSVVPPPERFAAIGERYNRGIDLAIGSDGALRVDLGFSVNFGGGPTDAVTVFENGFVSLASPGARAAAAAAGGFRPVDDLRDLGANVIAPFYADLSVGRGSGDGRLGVGDVFVQYGVADPYADDRGFFSEDDARRAVKITWFGLDAAGGAAYAGLLITQQDEEDANFEFLYGDDFFKPEQAGLGSIAGFSLGRGSLQFRGPYGQGSPTFFEFRNGVFVGQGATTVPEPSVWAQLILGFGALGAALRFVRARRTGSSLKSV